MHDNGELAQVGSTVVIKDVYGDCWEECKHLVGVNVQVMAIFDGLGKDNGKAIPMVSISNKDGSSCCFRADYCRPIDTRTDEEKALDDMMDTYFNPNEKRTSKHSPITITFLEAIKAGKIHGITWSK